MGKRIHRRGARGIAALQKSMNRTARALQRAKNAGKSQDTPIILAHWLSNKLRNEQPRLAGELMKKWEKNPVAPPPRGFVKPESQKEQTEKQWDRLKETMALLLRAQTPKNDKEVRLARNLCAHLRNTFHTETKQLRQFQFDAPDREIRELASTYRVRILRRVAQIDYWLHTMKKEKW